MIGDKHSCGMNEPRICEECHEKVKTEREEARTALREAIDCMLAGRGWAQHLERWSRIANAESEALT